MNRKKFIKLCGISCLGIASLGIILPSCVGSKIISAKIIDNNIILPLLEFEILNNNTQTFRKYIIIHNPQLQYPICVFRFSEKEYSALYMRCSHQGAELTVYGDKLVCPAHGSEFDNKGNFQNPPAYKPLTSFMVSIEQQYLKIAL